MTDKRKVALTDDELEVAAGGAGAGDLSEYYPKPGEIRFTYPLGTQMEICDCSTPFYDFTHRAVIKKRGYVFVNASDQNVMEPALRYAGNGQYYCNYQIVYFFEGHSDVQGWYSEAHLKNISTNNYADSCRIDGSLVHIVDQC